MKTSALILIFFPLLSWGHTLRLEGGSVTTGYNYYQIPGNTGTRVDLPEGGSSFYYRLNATYQFNEKHSLRFLYAPFLADYDYVPANNISFNGSTFSSGQPTTTSFKFNSYRASYLYQLDPWGDFNFQLGFTLKVRDAFIRMKNVNTTSTKANVGLVPLLNLGFNYKLTDSFRFAFDLDGAAAKQGRAFDGSLEGIYKFSEPISLGLGYRVLEGGADNEVVKNFALLHFYFASVYYNF